MSDTSGSSGWPVLCGVLGLLLCVVTVAAVLLLMRSHTKSSDLQQRWEADTRFFAEELKIAAQKIADESYAKVKAQHDLDKVQKQVLELQNQITALQLAHPPVKSP